MIDPEDFKHPVGCPCELCWQDRYAKASKERNRYYDALVWIAKEYPIGHEAGDAAREALKP